MIDAKAVSVQGVSNTKTNSDAKPKKLGFIKSIRVSLKKIRFLSREKVNSRFWIVAAIMTVCMLLIVGTDFGITKVGTLLTQLSTKMPAFLQSNSVIGIIISVIFLISALGLIVAETIRKSETRGFLSTNYTKKRFLDKDAALGKIVRICGIIAGVSAFLMYILG